MSFRVSLLIFSILAIAYLSHAHPLRSDNSKSAEITTDIATTTDSNAGKEIAIVETTAVVDTLNEPSNGRVKRQGGCGCCGCGCCCCRPRCCCCCRRCCTCCRTCCCTRCCTCCRPCCCCGCGGGCGCCGCGGGCGCCGCGCCGCGGGRKRRSLQALKIKLADKIERAARLALGTDVEQPKPVESTNGESEIIDEQLRKMEKVEETTTEWPQPVYELVTETYSQK